MANLVSEKDPFSNALIVDGMNLAFRWKHMGSTVFREDYLRTVMSLARSYKSGQVIIAADMGHSSYRREVFPDYKANRKDLYANDTPEQKALTEAFFQEYERVLETLDKYYLVLRYKNVEADDIAAYIVNRRKEYGINNIWMISSDRDWDLLVKENVSRFSTVTRKEVTVDTWPYEVDREHYLSYKVLMGDSGDNIPGIPGVGPKRATALIEQYGSAMDIYDACPLPGKQKFIQAVNENRDQIIKNYELMDLETYCEEAIGSSNVNDIGRRLMLNEYK